MPTPFYHLSIAEDLLVHPDLSEELRSFLRRNRGAFLFGNTAPDVQVVSGQPREATHFFDLPIYAGDRPAWELLFLAHPDLARLDRRSSAQAAFLAGYVCHLQADWLWVLNIFAPAFGPQASWASFTHRLYLHNVLRSYLDRAILPGLSNGMASKLKNAVPAGWLPFVLDHHLRAWRDTLVEQLKPGSVVQTVEVFASRQGISPEAFYRLLSSEEEMDREVFARLPRQVLVEYREQLVEENLRLLQNYLEWTGRSE